MAMIMWPFFFESLVIQCKDLTSIILPPEMTTYFVIFVSYSQSVLALYNTFIRPYFGKQCWSIAKIRGFADVSFKFALVGMDNPNVTDFVLLLGITRQAFTFYNITIVN